MGTEMAFAWGVDWENFGAFRAVASPADVDLAVEGLGLSAEYVGSRQLGRALCAALTHDSYL
ncbi:hypothetical protein ABZX12_26455 [Kribbella sp. NPDC003505]|uniref:hypothetical protein n=1 Tax=Kribbella sp. NPDC003505 TaxID=3154448 RepID=UPI0033AAEC93